MPIHVGWLIGKKRVRTSVRGRRKGQFVRKRRTTRRKK